MKTNNIIMGVLVAVIAVMGVAFAAFSTTLTINGTANISSSWKITYSAGTCTATTSTDAGGAVSNGNVSVDNGTVKVTAHMMSPGDVLKCTVIVKNESEGLKAIRNKWEIVSEVNNDAYEATVEAPTAAPLAATTGTETLTVVVKYKDVTEKPTGSATFTAQANYIQATA